MIDSISARYVLTENDLIAAARTHNRMTMTPYRQFARWLCLMILLSVSFVALPVVLLWDNSPSKRASLVPIFALVIFGWFIVWIGLIGWKIDVRQSLRKIPHVERAMEWTIDDQWLSYKTSLTEIRMRWEQIKKFVETPSGFLIYHSRDFFKPLPNHAFTTTESINQFADLARLKVPNYVVLGLCQFPAKPEPIGLDEL